jgi:hypothetical protein
MIVTVAALEPKQAGKAEQAEQAPLAFVTIVIIRGHGHTSVSQGRVGRCALGHGSTGAYR